ncbi:MAG: TonB family protein [Lysobacteraceae bacterium]|nr:MAG: TonB family protein [Xanthomonadaceae bacterium]
MSTLRTLTAQGTRWGLSRRAWRIIVGGFALGLLLGLGAFLLMWLDQRNDKEFYRAEGKPDQVDGQIFEPLPAPLPGESASRGASGMSEAAEAAANRPRPIEQRPSPSVAPSPGNPVAATTAPTQSRPEPTLAPGSQPVAISRPAPKYPSDALRRGESGKVVVRVDVGADGVPTEVSLVERSRSRSLDRAALQAARQWRFRPAQRGGQAIAGTVEIPIEFTLQR